MVTTATNNCELVQLACWALYGRSQEDVVYADFSKLIDRVTHSIMFTLPLVQKNNKAI